MDRALVRHGFVLTLLALVAGFAIPAMRVPRLGLSAHIIGLISGLLLIVVGLIWNNLRIARSTRSALRWMWLVVAFGNWLGTILAATFGGSQLMPIAGGSSVPEKIYDVIITFIIGLVSVLSILALCFTIYGLRGKSDY